MQYVSRPRFQQRHYEAIAEVLHREGDRTTTRALAKMFARDNPKFKPDFFMLKSGFPSLRVCPDPTREPTERPNDTNR